MLACPGCSPRRSPRVYHRRVVRLVLALCLVAGVARADEVDDLVARGQALGKDGQWTQAIAAFKAADAKQKRALHACLIGLAYTRREAWGQAELFFATCRERAQTGDPVPDWLAEAEQQLAAKIAATATPAVTITVVPAGAARIAVSGFPADETFAPRTIHLAPGSYTITASAPGFAPTDRAITVVTGSAQALRIELDRGGGSRLPLYLYVTAGALAVAGIVYDELEVQSVRDDLAASNGGFETEHATFEHRRDLAIGLFAGAIVTAGAGAILHYTTSRDVEVAASIAPGAAAIQIGWRQ
jgi:hypothetical protein